MKMLSPSAHATKINDQISLWFPDAIVPTMRTLESGIGFQLTLGEKDQIWHIFLHAPNTDRISIAEYNDEKSARRALNRVANRISGGVERTRWWYARWGVALATMVFVVIMEIAIAFNKPEDFASGNLYTAPSVASGGRPAGAVPMSSFAAAPPGMAPTQQFANPMTPSSIPSAPVDPTPKPQSTGLSAFGLDERTPPEGISGIKSNGKIDSLNAAINKKGNASDSNGGIIGTGQNSVPPVAPMGGQ